MSAELRIIITDEGTDQIQPEPLPQPVAPPPQPIQQPAPLAQPTPTPAQPRPSPPASQPPAQPPAQPAPKPPSLPSLPSPATPPKPQPITQPSVAVPQPRPATSITPAAPVVAAVPLKPSQAAVQPAASVTPRQAAPPPQPVVPVAPPKQPQAAPQPPAAPMPQPKPPIAQPEAVQVRPTPPVQPKPEVSPSAKPKPPEPPAIVAKPTQQPTAQPVAAKPREPEVVERKLVKEAPKEPVKSVVVAPKPVDPWQMDAKAQQRTIDAMTAKSIAEQLRKDNEEADETDDVEDLREQLADVWNQKRAVASILAKGESLPDGAKGRYPDVEAAVVAERKRPARPPEEAAGEEPEAVDEEPQPKDSVYRPTDAEPATEREDQPEEPESEVKEPMVKPEAAPEEPAVVEAYREEREEREQPDAPAVPPKREDEGGEAESDFPSDVPTDVQKAEPESVQERKPLAKPKPAVVAANDRVEPTEEDAVEPKRVEVEQPKIVKVKKKQKAAEQAEATEAEPLEPMLEPPESLEPLEPPTDGAPTEVVPGRQASRKKASDERRDVPIDDAPQIESVEQVADVEVASAKRAEPIPEEEVADSPGRPGKPIEDVVEQVKEFADEREPEHVEEARPDEQPEVPVAAEEPEPDAAEPQKPKRKPHQMTTAEFTDAHPHIPKSAAKKAHRHAVENALSIGTMVQPKYAEAFEVPEPVLAEHPDVAEKYGKPTAKPTQPEQVTDAAEPPTAAEKLLAAPEAKEAKESDAPDDAAPIKQPDTAEQEPHPAEPEQAEPVPIAQAEPQPMPSPKPKRAKDTKKPKPRQKPSVAAEVEVAEKPKQSLPESPSVEPTVADGDQPAEKPRQHVELPELQEHIDISDKDVMGFPMAPEWKYIPKDAELLGSGAEAQVFRQPDADEVYRVENRKELGSGAEDRPDIPSVLQPIAQKRVEYPNGKNVVVEKMPYAPSFTDVMKNAPEPKSYDETPSAQWEKVRDDLKEKLAQEGYEHTDLTPRNVGKRGDEWVVIDPGGIKRLPDHATQKQPGTEEQRPARQPTAAPEAADDKPEPILGDDDASPERETEELPATDGIITDDDRIIPDAIIPSSEPPIAEPQPRDEDAAPERKEPDPSTEVEEEPAFPEKEPFTNPTEVIEQPERPPTEPVEAKSDVAPERPVAPKQKQAVAPERKKPVAKSLYKIVQDMGGISMKSLEQHGFDTKAYRESGLGGLFRKKGGRDISEIASELHNEGHVIIPGVDYHGTGASAGKMRQKTLPKEAPEYVMDLLQEKTESLSVDLDDQLQRDEEAHYKEKENAKRFGFTGRDIEAIERAGQADRGTEEEKGDAYEGPGGVAEEDEFPWERERREAELEPDPWDVPEVTKAPREEEDETGADRTTDRRGPEFGFDAAPDVQEVAVPQDFGEQGELADEDAETIVPERVADRQQDEIKREPHEMDRSDWYGDDRADAEDPARQHREAVQAAVAAGKRVPWSVLHDYPDIAEQVPRWHVTSQTDKIRKEGFKASGAKGVGGAVAGEGVSVWKDERDADGLLETMREMESVRTSDTPTEDAVKVAGKPIESTDKIAKMYADELKRSLTERERAIVHASTKNPYVPAKSFFHDEPARDFQKMKVAIAPGAKAKANSELEELYDPEQVSPAEPAVDSAVASKGEAVAEKPEPERAEPPAAEAPSTNRRISMEQWEAIPPKERDTFLKQYDMLPPEGAEQPPEAPADDPVIEEKAEKKLAKRQENVKIDAEMRRQSPQYAQEAETKDKRKEASAKLAEFTQKKKEERLAQQDLPEEAQIERLAQEKAEKDTRSIIVKERAKEIRVERGEVLPAERPAKDDIDGQAADAVDREKRKREVEAKRREIDPEYRAKAEADDLKKKEASDRERKRSELESLAESDRIEQLAKEKADKETTAAAVKDRVKEIRVERGEEVAPERPAKDDVKGQAAERIAREKREREIDAEMREMDAEYRAKAELKDAYDENAKAIRELAEAARLERILLERMTAEEKIEHLGKKEADRQVEAKAVKEKADEIIGRDKKSFDPYAEADKKREAAIRAEQVKAAYEENRPAKSGFDATMEVAEQLRGTLGGTFGRLVGSLLDVASAYRSMNPQKSPEREEAERRNAKIRKGEEEVEEFVDATEILEREETAAPEAAPEKPSEAVAETEDADIPTALRVEDVPVVIPVAEPVPSKQDAAPERAVKPAVPDDDIPTARLAPPEEPAAPDQSQRQIDSLFGKDFTDELDAVKEDRVPERQVPAADDWADAFGDRDEDAERHAKPIPVDVPGSLEVAETRPIPVDSPDSLEVSPVKPIGVDDAGTVPVNEPDPLDVAPVGKLKVKPQDDLEVAETPPIKVEAPKPAVVDQVGTIAVEEPKPLTVADAGQVEVNRPKPIDVADAGPVPVVPAKPVRIDTPDSISTEKPGKVKVNAPDEIASDAPESVHVDVPDRIPVDDPGSVGVETPRRARVEDVEDIAVEKHQPVKIDAPESVESLPAEPVEIDTPESIKTTEADAIAVDSPESIPVAPTSPVRINTPDSVATERPGKVRIDVPGEVKADSPQPVPISTPDAIASDAPASVHVEAPSSIPTDAPDVIHVDAPKTIRVDAPESIAADSLPRAAIKDDAPLAAVADDLPVAEFAQSKSGESTSAESTEVIAPSTTFKIGDKATKEPLPAGPRTDSPFEEEIADEIHELSEAMKASIRKEEEVVYGMRDLAEVIKASKREKDDDGQKPASADTTEVGRGSTSQDAPRDEVADDEPIPRAKRQEQPVDEAANPPVRREAPVKPKEKRDEIEVPVARIAPPVQSESEADRFAEKEAASVSQQAESGDEAAGELRELAESLKANRRVEGEVAEGLHALAKALKDSDKKRDKKEPAPATDDKKAEDEEAVDEAEKPQESSEVEPGKPSAGKEKTEKDEAPAKQEQPQAEPKKQEASPEAEPKKPAKPAQDDQDTPEKPDGKKADAETPAEPKEKPKAAKPKQADTDVAPSRPMSKPSANPSQSAAQSAPVTPKPTTAAATGSANVGGAAATAGKAAAGASGAASGAAGAGAAGGAMAAGAAVAGPIALAVAAIEAAKAVKEMAVGSVRSASAAMSSAASFEDGATRVNQVGDGMKAVADKVFYVAPVLGTLGAMAGEAVKGVSELSRAVKGTADRLAQYNGNLAVQQANQEFVEIMRDINRSSRFGEVTGGANEARFKMEQKLQDITDRFIPPIMKIGEAVFGVLEKTFTTMEEFFKKSIEIAIRAVEFMRENRQVGVALMGALIGPAGAAAGAGGLNGLLGQILDTLRLMLADTGVAQNEWDQFMLGRWNQGGAGGVAPLLAAPAAAVMAPAN